MAQGYAWLPDRLRGTGGAPVQTRLLGKRATALHGRDAVHFFYDSDHIRRRSALPGPVLDTLFGRGAVHTLDGQQHAARKALFMALLKTDDAVAALAEQAGDQWDVAAKEWATHPQVELFTASSEVIAQSVCAWAGIPLAPDEAPSLAADLVAMVDGFATVGPRHWKARRARARREMWLQDLIGGLRTATAAGDVASPDSALQRVALHRDDTGQLLSAQTAAVEVLNIIRPATAVAWFVTFAAHALHRWPDRREALREGGTSEALAFAHEVRRFYPFVPFVGGLAAQDLHWKDVAIPEGSLVLLDVYGHQHDADLWPEPYRFNPARFLDRSMASDELIPQGGGDTASGHRCPGEDITLALLTVLSGRLAGMTYSVPPQDLSISLHRVPARPRSGFRMSLRTSNSGTV
ncbi:cytochrome P450 [Streptomyces sp. NBC_00306]|uniref:cytochrome P450 n=1 Tax=Streptomyces sp. NBC_00306 TaxID=2975708 RepID=UPI002E2E2948|nr:cytochrome P450 [Streptomyces sp. NBC_00306]